MKRHIRTLPSEMMLFPSPPAKEVEAHRAWYLIGSKVSRFNSPWWKAGFCKGAASVAPQMLDNKLMGFSP